MCGVVTGQRMSSHSWRCCESLASIIARQVLMGRYRGGHKGQEATSLSPIKRKRKRQSSEKALASGGPSQARSPGGATCSSIWRVLSQDFNHKLAHQRIHLLHNLLHLQPQHHATFQQLVTRYFQEPINNLTITERIAERGQDIIAKELGFFLQEHGPSLWPPHLPRRTHLCKIPAPDSLARCWRGGTGPILVLHGKVTGEARKRWLEKHGGRIKELEDELAASNFGEAMQAYVAALMEEGSLMALPETSYDEVARLKRFTIGDGSIDQTTEPGGMPDVPQTPDVVDILGDERFVPTAAQLLQEQPSMTTKQLRKLKRVLQNCVAARTDFGALTTEFK